MRENWWKSSLKRGVSVEEVKIQALEEVLRAASSAMGTGVSSSPASWIAGLQAARSASDKIRGRVPKLVLLFATEDYDPKALIQGVNFVTGNTPLLGSFTHGYVFNEETVLKNGVVLAIFAPEDVEFSLGVSENPDKNLTETVENALAPVVTRHETLRNRGFPKLSLFVLTDTYVDPDALLDEIHLRVGSDVPISGGIMSDAGFERGSLFWRREVLKDVLIILGIHGKHTTGIGISHGFHPVIPFRVTKSRGNLIKELDDRPALDVLREVFAKKGIGEKEIDLERLFPRFQFGMPDPRKPGTSWIRMPVLALPDGSLKIAGTAEEGTTVWLMEARGEQMHQAVRKAIDLALGNEPWEKITGGLILSGFSRSLAMGENYFKEVEALGKRTGVPFVAANSYIEFICTREGYRGTSTSSILLTLIP